MSEAQDGPASRAATLYEDHQQVVDELADREDETGAIARALKELADEVDD